MALGELGRSSDHRDRADAGRGLAGFVEMEDTVGPLLELVLDRDLDRDALDFLAATGAVLDVDEYDMTG